MNEVVLLVEELSAKVMLESLLPRIHQPAPKITIISFQGKSDLEKRVEKKIRGYQNRNAYFIVMRDQDSADCLTIKNNLLDKCQRTQKQCLVRILCHELESWYLADLSAVEQALDIHGISVKQHQAKYRAPDNLSNAKQELQRIVPAYQEVSSSRKIGMYLDINNGRSISFSIFIKGYKRILKELDAKVGVVSP
ncbi:MAG: DUF4276 family protein [Leptospiraceae bacterium]|nr:DUF4276 family protein [Leptospiraceae bacterium]